MLHHLHTVTVPAQFKPESTALVRLRGPSAPGRTESPTLRLMIFGGLYEVSGAYFRLCILVLPLSRNSHAPPSWTSLLAAEPPERGITAIACLSGCEVATTVWILPFTGMDCRISVLVVPPAVDLCASSIQRHRGP